MGSGIGPAGADVPGVRRPRPYPVPCSALDIVGPHGIHPAVGFEGEIGLPVVGRGRVAPRALRGHREIIIRAPRQAGQHHAVARPVGRQVALGQIRRHPRPVGHQRIRRHIGRPGHRRRAVRNGRHLHARYDQRRAHRHAEPRVPRVGAVGAPRHRKRDDMTVQRPRPHREREVVGVRLCRARHRDVRPGGRPVRDGGKVRTLRQRPRDPRPRVRPDVGQRHRHHDRLARVGDPVPVPRRIVDGVAGMRQPGPLGNDDIGRPFVGDGIDGRGGDIQHSHARQGRADGDRDIPVGVGGAELMDGVPAVALGQADTGALQGRTGAGDRHGERGGPHGEGGGVRRGERERHFGVKLHGWVAAQEAHVHVVVSPARGEVGVEIEHGVDHELPDPVLAAREDLLEPLFLDVVVFAPVGTFGRPPVADGHLPHAGLAEGGGTDAVGDAAVAHHEGGHLAAGRGRKVRLGHGGTGPVADAAVARVDDHGAAVVEGIHHIVTGGRSAAAIVLDAPDEVAARVGPAGIIFPRVAGGFGVGGLDGFMGVVGVVGGVAGGGETGLFDPRRLDEIRLGVGHEPVEHLGGLRRGGERDAADVGVVQVIAAGEAGVVAVGSAAGTGRSVGGGDGVGVSDQDDIGEGRVGPGVVGALDVGLDGRGRAPGRARVHVLDEVAHLPAPLDEGFRIAVIGRGGDDQDAVPVARPGLPAGRGLVQHAVVENHFREVGLVGRGEGARQFRARGRVVAPLHDQVEPEVRRDAEDPFRWVVGKGLDLHDGHAVAAVERDARHAGDRLGHEGIGGVVGLVLVVGPVVPAVRGLEDGFLDGDDEIGDAELGLEIVQGVRGAHPQGKGGLVGHFHQKTQGGELGLPQFPREGLAGEGEFLEGPPLRDEIPDEDPGNVDLEFDALGPLRGGGHQGRFGLGGPLVEGVPNPSIGHGGQTRQCDDEDENPDPHGCLLDLPTHGITGSMTNDGFDCSPK